MEYHRNLAEYRRDRGVALDQLQRDTVLPSGASLTIIVLLWIILSAVWPLI